MAWNGGKEALKATECLFNWELRGRYRRDNLIKKWREMLYEDVHVSSYKYRWSVRLCYAFELFNDGDPNAVIEMMEAIVDLEGADEGVCKKYRVSCQHIIYATLAHMQFLNGDPVFKDTFDQIPRFAYMSDEHKAGVLGMKANILRLYSGGEIHQCIAFLREARKLDPDEYTWKISLISSLTRARRYKRDRVERKKGNLFYVAFKRLREVLDLIEAAKIDEKDYPALLYYEASAYEDYIRHKNPSKKIDEYKNQITQMWRRILFLKSSTPTYVSHSTRWFVEHSTQDDWDSCCRAILGVLGRFRSNRDGLGAAKLIDGLPLRYRNSSDAARELSALMGEIAAV